MYQFKGPRYLTIGIQQKLDIDIQVFLWKLVEDMLFKHGNLDYLQVFKLKTVVFNGNKPQQITHLQEVPPFEYTVQFEAINPINEKIFVIDDVECVTMLLSIEY